MMMSFLSIFGFAQDQGSATPSPAPAVASSPSPVASVAPMGSSTVSTISSAVDKIPTAIPAWILAVIAFVVELAMRFWPTVQPRSLFIFAGQLFAVIGAGFKKISDLLDLVVQNLQDPAAK